ncbi:MAG: DNA-binding protein [Verrucomicrobia bacterium]|nr:MAG: DNA-binding protein [Verrucomicrobiota bacterium]
MVHARHRTRRQGPPCELKAVCFHAQQCAEKYLKALLTERNVRFPKMRHLPTLLDLLVPVCLDAEACREDLSSLAPFAVDLRYPGGKVNLQTADVAWRTCGRIRSFIRPQLGLEG